MSTLQNEMILESIFDEVVTEWINDLSFVAEILGRPLTENDLHLPGVETEVMKRFEDMCQ